MVRTGKQYRSALADGREVWLDRERVEDVSDHPAFRTAIGLRARLYDLAARARLAEGLPGETSPRRRNNLLNPPATQQDWQAMIDAAERRLAHCGTMVLALGDPMSGDLWGLMDGSAMLAKGPVAGRIDAQVARTLQHDLFQPAASWNAEAELPLRGEPPGSVEAEGITLGPRLIRETGAGLVLRGLWIAPSTAIADQFYLRPGLGPNGFACIVRAATPGLRHLCRAGPVFDADPGSVTATGLGQTMVVFDDATIPWDDVLFLAEPALARETLRCQQVYGQASVLLQARQELDLLLGAIMWMARLTGAEGLPEVQSDLAELACFRAGVSAHLSAAIGHGAVSAAGLWFPDATLLHAGVLFLRGRSAGMLDLARQLLAAQVNLTTAMAPPGEAGGPGGWLGRFQQLALPWALRDRQRLMAFAHEMLERNDAEDRAVFRPIDADLERFGLAQIYHKYDFSGPLQLARRCAGLSDKVLAP